MFLPCLHYCHPFPSSSSTRINEPAHDKTYNKTCVTNKGSDQPVHLHSMARALVYSSLNILEAVEGTCDQRKMIRLR